MEESGQLHTPAALTTGPGTYLVEGLVHTRSALDGVKKILDTTGTGAPTPRLSSHGQSY
jgi:hypothetical protein